jgi:hypothetical protein
MRRAELAAALLATATLTACGGSSGGTTGASRPASGLGSTAPSTSTSTAAGTPATPSKRATRGHQPPCSYCGAGRHPAAAAKAVLTASDPIAACGVLATPRYLKTAYGGRGGCVAAIRGGAAAHSARVVAARRSHGMALVIAIPSGGPSSGERLRVSMVHESAPLASGRTPPLWRVESIRSNAKVGP